MEVKRLNKNLQFLAGGGEMGKLTREKDWAETSLGAPQTWPQSLRTTLSIVLNSKFPMFLFWGEELTCFYNDAYRPSLGREGKHPSILGMSGEEAWPEIWEIIKPLIDQVLAGGEATWSEDQLIPIYRNGKIEDVYWTFSYSPVNDETGKPAGVFVTCTESTEKINLLKQLENSNDELAFAIEAAELGTWDYDPVHNKFSANKRLRDWFGLPSKTEVELVHATEAIAEADKERVIAAIQKVLDPSSGGHYDIEYTIINPVSKKETIVHAKGRVWFDNDKKPYRFNGTMEDVSEQTAARKKMENAFKEIEQQQQKLNIVINASELATWELNVKTGEVNYSNRYLEIMGHEKNKKLTQQQLLTQLHPDDIHKRELAYKEAYITGILHFECRIFWADNSIHWIDCRGKLFYDKDGNPSNMVGTLRDITDEKKYQRQLEEREQKFRLLADSMPQHIWTSDPQGNLNYFNQSVFKYTGLTPEQINKEGWIQIVHPDDREGNIKAWTEAISTGKDFLFDHRFRKHTGEYRWQLSRAVPQRDENGEIQMWVGTSTDIEEKKNISDELEKLVEKRTRELKLLNESLLKSERRYHLMVEEVQDYAILYLNREGIVQNWNAGAERIKGYKAAEIIGKSFFNFYTREDRQNNLPQSLLKQAAETGRAGQEGWRVRKDGTRFWANVVITAVHDENGNVMGFSKVTHDLTDKKNTDDALKKNASELEQKNTELEKMNKELQSFAYVSSHDLQEPLRKIQTFASRILEKEHGNLSEHGKELFDRMQGSAKRMQALINDLLTYSRTHNADRKLEVTDLKEVIEGVKQELKEELEQTKAILETNELCLARIVPFQFHQLFYNLISNSLKFSRPGHPPVIKIKAQIVEGRSTGNPQLSIHQKYCHISISDNGIGFDPQYSEKIFELFQRLHGKMEYTGTGIGLAIVKKIVENHNGIITANAGTNQGATFDIYIPAA